MLNKKNSLFLIVTLTLSFFLYYRGITPLIAGQNKNQEDNIYKQLELFNIVISKIQRDYVTEVTAKDLIYGALKGMLRSLDSHSQFMDPPSYKEMKVDTEGQFGGLGIEITMQDNVLTVVSPIEDTPAFDVGLQPNDKIVRIEGKTTKNMTLMEAVKKLRGKPGTKVTINILRPETHEFLEISIIRAIIKIQSVKGVKMLADGIGYIRLTQFQEKSSKELENAMNDLEKEGMKGLILDLRSNPGGLLNEAIAVADKFIGGGKMIVSTKGRIVSQNREYRASSTATHPDITLIVLVNGGSASASEIVAGAVKDWRRGILLGTKTFGKGSVQSVFPLKDGSALRLTTAKYFTPSGICIHKVGIEPDIEVAYKNLIEKEDDKDKKEDAFSEEEAADKKDQEEETDEPDSTDNQEADEKEEKKTYPPLSDTQVVRAVDLIRGIHILSEENTLLDKKDTISETGYEVEE